MREKNARQQAETLLEEKTMELYLANKELRKINSSLERRVKERTRNLVQWNKKQEFFLSQMSHEIRTPIAGIVSASEILRLENINSEAKHLVSVIKDSGNTLLKIADDFLDYSKLRAKAVSVENVPFDLRDVLDKTINLLLPASQQAGLRLFLFVDPRIPEEIVGDAHRLKQVIINLISNAIKFTSHGYVMIRVLNLSMDNSNVKLKIEVEDTGIGIDLSKDNQCKLFTPFFQADMSTARHYGGTGLGLSICKQLSDLMNGQIGVASKIGVGTTFWISLPFAIAPKKYVKQRLNLSALRILILSKDALGADVLKQYLDYFKASTCIINHPNETVNIDHKIDYIFIDEEMHSLSGIKIINCIKNSDRLSNAKLVMLTHHNSANIAQYAIELGYKSSLSLPIRYSDIYKFFLCHINPAPTYLNDGALIDSKGYLKPELEVAKRAGIVILVVDDNPTNILVIQKMLSKLGYCSRAVTDGKAALASYNEQEFGLIITDYNMPGIDGYQLAKKIRDREKLTGYRVPIIGLSAFAHGNCERFTCKKSGIDRCYTKPLSISKLERIIQEFVPKASNFRKLREQVSINVSPDDNSFELKQPLSNEPDVVSKIFELFKVSTIPILDDLDQFIHNKDIRGVQEAIHTISGAAGWVGAHSLLSLCTDIAGDLMVSSDETVIKNASEIRIEFNKYLDASAKDKEYNLRKQFVA